jgi:hypothetical protein
MAISEGSLDISSASSDTSYSSDDEYRLVQQEWQESLAQLHRLVSFVLIPFVGKWLGRRWSYWGEYSYLYTTSILINDHVSLCSLCTTGVGYVIFPGRASMGSQEHC